MSGLLDSRNKPAIESSNASAARRRSSCTLPIRSDIQGTLWSPTTFSPWSFIRQREEFSISATGTSAVPPAALMAFFRHSLLASTYESGASTQIANQLCSQQSPDLGGARRGREANQHRASPKVVPGGGERMSPCVRPRMVRSQMAGPKARDTASIICEKVQRHDV